MINFKYRTGFVTRSESGLSQSMYLVINRILNSFKYVCISYNIISIHFIPMVYSFTIKTAFIFYHLNVNSHYK